MIFEIGDYIKAGRGNAHLCRITDLLPGDRARVMEFDHLIGHLHEDIEIVELWDVQKIEPAEAMDEIRWEVDRFNSGVKNFIRKLK